MRTLIALSLVSLASLAACADTTTGDASELAAPAEALQSHGGHGSKLPKCAEAPEAIRDAFEAFDAATTPPALGQPASVVLAPWLAYLDANVVFESGNDAPRVGPAAVAGYFEPLLPFIGSVVHDLDSVSPVCGIDGAWSVRGTLLISRRSDGVAIAPIPFTDTLTFDDEGEHIVGYEIRFDPAPIGQLFAP